MRFVVLVLSLLAIQLTQSAWEASPLAGESPPSDQVFPLIPIPHKDMLDALASQQEHGSIQAGATASTIFGPDDRSRIFDTSPWRFVAQIFLYDKVPVPGVLPFGTCTGFLVSPTLVVTAGHCLFDDSHPLAVSAIVVPGQNGNDNPNGFASAIKFGVPGQWSANRDPAFDIGILMLQPTLSSSFAPILPVVAVPDTYFLVGSTFSSAGYPSDKEPGTMWFESDLPWGGPTPSADFIFTKMDVLEGQSGSPVIIASEGRENLLAVVGVLTSGNSTTNRAVRFTHRTFDALIAICEVAGCTLQLFTFIGQPDPLTPHRAIVPALIRN